MAWSMVNLYKSLSNNEVMMGARVMIFPKRYLGYDSKFLGERGKICTLNQKFCDCYVVLPIQQLLPSFALPKRPMIDRSMPMSDIGSGANGLVNETFGGMDGLCHTHPLGKLCCDTC